MLKSVALSRHCKSPKGYWTVNLTYKPFHHCRWANYSIRRFIMVYVISQSGKKLMPTNRHGKVRRLLKEGKAKVVDRNPFTIQFLYETTEFTREVQVGFDIGYRHQGFVLVANNKIIEKGEIELRTDISSLLKTRADYRRGRRYRKTRYRAARWANRRKKDGWLPPSVQNRYNHIVAWINRLTKYLPDYQLTVEIASFDIHKIINPDIEGADYQHGDLYQYENMKAYLIAREQAKCQLCGKELADSPWRIHHIRQRKEGGSDRPENLALLHEACHEKLHKENLNHKLKKAKQYKYATFMNNIRWKLVNELKENHNGKVSFTYGYIIKLRRYDLGLEKTHYNDAIAITKQDIRDNSIVPLKIKQVRKKKRSLHEATPRKGRKEPNRTAKRNEKNTKLVDTKYGRFCLHDKVRVGSKTGFVSGFSAKQLYVVDIDGNYLMQEGKSYKQINSVRVKHITRNNNFIISRLSA